MIRADRHGPLLGADPRGGATAFGAWAPQATRCAVRIVDDQARMVSTYPLAATGTGYWGAQVEGIGPGARYLFELDDRVLTDPFARFLPDGVHGPAMVVEDRHPWRHGPGVERPLDRHVIYELHVGTFTEEGTYRAASERFAELADLGVTTLELMPVAAFAGRHGWGYDGVAPYAPFAPYGSPDDLRRLVDEAHGLGLSVVLDVVWNHLGPAGNYLGAYDPAFFTREIQNAWGDALDFRHPVLRRHVVANAEMWLREFRFDGLRLDATHAIVDPGPRHVLREVADAVRAIAPRKVLFAEDDRNQPALVRDLGMDAVWADDLHHQIRVTLTGERDGYFAAYRPGAEDLARTIEGGWLYQGEIYPPWGAARGAPSGDLPASAFVTCLQNHDQVGNRALGDRLGAAVDLDALRAVTTLLLFLPFTPLLFMGQEWAASTPFLYFTDHDEELGRLVDEGRRRELASFSAFSDPAARARIPAPQAITTFTASRLRWSEREQGAHREVLQLHRDLLALRRSDPVLSCNTRDGLRAEALGEVLLVERRGAGQRRTLLVDLGATDDQRRAVEPRLAGATVVLASDGSSGARELPRRGAVILASG